MAAAATTALIIKSWNVATTPDGEGNLVHIEGRQPGFMAWILDLMGISTVTTLKVSKDFVTLAKGDLSGQSHVSIPMGKVSGVVAGYKKPFLEALALGVSLGVATFGFGIIIAAVYYYLAKPKLSVGVMAGSQEVALVFREGTVNGAKIGQSEAEEVAALIQSHLA